jgi:hypothetical protein
MARCDAFEYDVQTVRRYLHDDLGVSCSSGEYEMTRTIAFPLVYLWPLGVPLLDTVLLQMRRKAIINGIPSTLSSSTAFLVGAVRNVSQVDAQYAARVQTLAV